jgi:1,4-dihydroxy-2-naphthoate octaprenyltransferase
MTNNKQEWRDAFRHLRLHFSLLLMPVFLFASSQVKEISVPCASITFLVLHLLIYPASNIFNSYYDIDQGSVGGLKNPPPSSIKMLWLANSLDALALFGSILISNYFAVLILVYILASRLYSYRPIRLKKYPITGFFVIFIFQGAFTYYIACTGVLGYSDGCFLYEKTNHNNWFFAALATSFQIGAIYPLTQIYQHKSDLADGVTTLSYKIGYRGTFIFSGIMFGIATLFYYLYFKETDIYSFYLLLVVQIPIILYFAYWASLVWKDTKFADYKHTMRMNVIAALVLNLFFLYLVIR